MYLSVVHVAPLPAGGSYEVYASYYEIYNEQVFDLLEDIPEDLPSDQVYRRKVCVSVVFLFVVYLFMSSQDRDQSPNAFSLLLFYCCSTLNVSHMYACCACRC